MLHRITTHVKASHLLYEYYYGLEVPTPHQRDHYCYVARLENSNSATTSVCLLKIILIRLLPERGTYNATDAGEAESNCCEASRLRI